LLGDHHVGDLFADGIETLQYIHHSGADGDGAGYRDGDFISEYRRVARNNNSALPHAAILLAKFDDVSHGILPQAESVSLNMATRQMSCTQNYRRSPEGSVNVWRVFNLLQAWIRKSEWRVQ